MTRLEILQQRLWLGSLPEFFSLFASALFLECTALGSLEFASQLFVIGRAGTEPEGPAAPGDKTALVNYSGRNPAEKEGNSSMARLTRISPQPWSA